MDKIKTVKIKNLDGSVSEETYTISVNAKDVDMKNGKDLQDTIGDINVDRDGSIAKQLGKYKDYSSDIETLYADVDSLEAADTDLENDIIDLQVNKINKTDIIDNLNSSSNTKVLSAKQGKVLGDVVAEKVAISDIENNLNSEAIAKPLSAKQGKVLNNSITEILSERTIFVGDSYAAGVTNTTGVYIDSWVDYMILKMGLSEGDFYKIALPGSGFLRAGSSTNMTFLQGLENIENNVVSKDTIKNIIVCGGYNDNTYTLANIQAAITIFVDYCKTTYPNATVYIGEIAYRYGNTSDDVQTKANIQNVVYNAYANCTPSSENRTNDYVYLHGVENILKSCVKNFMYASNAHPKEAGQKALANGIYQSFKSGNCEIYQNNTGIVTPVNSGTYDGELNFTYVNETFFIKFKKMQFNWTTGTMSLTNGSGNKIADVVANDFIGTVTPANSSISCLANIQDYTAGRYVVPATIFFDTDGSLMLYIWCTNGSGQSVTLGNIKEIILYRASTSMPAILN